MTEDEGRQSELAAEQATDPGRGLPPESQQVSRKLVESLVCPATGSRLQYDAEKGELISKAAMLAYPIRSGIPIMLIDEARKIEG